ncbi:hypothetical protein CRG98_028252 [Punica granatum]|uniref:Uncharacterized protein n=1 Tax=Punica granatum TaxID=22663 RepID=A0A2I0J586_PUNGR|nr:hypothetical protein CRG98_028252 [Punica granatum]
MSKDRELEYIKQRLYTGLSVSQSTAASEKNTDGGTEMRGTERGQKLTGKESLIEEPLECQVGDESDGEEALEWRVGDESDGGESMIEDESERQSNLGYEISIQFREPIPVPILGTL